MTRTSLHPATTADPFAATSDDSEPDPGTEPLHPLWADPARPADAIVNPCARLHGRIHAQPSKNYTTRYLLAAGMAAGTTTVEGLATSDDAAAMVRVLRAMGATVEIADDFNDDGTPKNRRASIAGFAARPALHSVHAPDGRIDVGNAGAVLRLALGVGSLLPDVTFTTHHTDSLGKRPNADLLDALAKIGVRVEAGPDGRLPIRLQGAHGLMAAQPSAGPVSIEVSGAKSSQFLSSLLFLAPCLDRPVRIEVTGGRLVSQPAIQQTLDTLRACGARITAADDMMSFQIQPGRISCPPSLRVNGDWPGSAAILAAAAILPGEVEVLGLMADSQGERLSQRVVAAYGAAVSPICAYRPRFAQTGVAINGGQTLHSIDIDGDPLTDAVLAMLAPACYAHGTTRIHNVHNLRIKECDRISEPLAELRKLGVKCWEGNQCGDHDPDSIHIEGAPGGYDGGITVDGRGDHRVIMLLAVVALRTRKGLRIAGAHHVAKSYPGFFRDLHRLGAEVALVPPASTPKHIGPR